MYDFVGFRLEDWCLTATFMVTRIGMNVSK